MSGRVLVQFMFVCINRVYVSDIHYYCFSKKVGSVAKMSVQGLRGLSQFRDVPDHNPQLEMRLLVL